MGHAAPATKGPSGASPCTALAVSATAPPHGRKAAVFRRVLRRLLPPRHLRRLLLLALLLVHTVVALRRRRRLLQLHREATPILRWPLLLRVDRLRLSLRAGPFPPTPPPDVPPLERGA